MTSRPSPKRKVFSLPNDKTFHLLFKNNPTPMWVYDLKTLAFLEVNDAALEKYGYTRDEFLKLTLKDIRPAEDVARLTKDVKQKRPALQHSGEWRHRLKNGQVIDVEITSHTMEFERRKAALVMAQDITDRKRGEEQLRHTNRALRMLSECNQIIVQAVNETTLLQQICRVIVEAGGYRLCWVGYAAQDEGKTVQPMAQAGYEEGYLETLKLTWADSERGRGPTGTTIRSGQPTIAPSIQTAPAFAPWRAEAIKRGYASSIALPLSRDKTFGALNIYAAEPEAFASSQEVKLLVALASDLAYGIATLRARAEREQAQEAQRESEEKYRQLVELAPNGILVHVDEKIVFVNSAGARMFGAATPKDLLGKPMLSFVHPDYQKIVMDRIKELTENKQEVTWIEEKHVRLDGAVIDTEVKAIPFRYGNKNAALAVFNDITERKQAQETLRKTEARFRDVIENIFKFVPEGLLVLTDKLNVFRRNKALEDLVHQYADKLDYTEEELANVINEQVKMRIVSGEKSDICIPRKQK